MSQYKYKREVMKQIEELKRTGKLCETKGFIQHGNMSVYKHCVCVALCSCQIADALHISVDKKALIRGALLHDYFLYDWHEADNGHRLHGFTHPATALTNARRDYDLSETEADIIEHHMFPLTIKPPTCREAWIVCMADKICAGRETMKGFMRRWQRH